MTDRVIVTDVAHLAAVLDRLDRAAARRGWRVRRPADAAGLEQRAQTAPGAWRLPSPVVVSLEIDPDAAGPATPVDAAALLARVPVAGAVADGRRHPHLP